MMGERSFKNIAQPIRTFSISEADGAVMPAASGRERQIGGKLLGIVAALVVLIAATGSGFYIYRNYETQRAEELRRAVEVERQATESKRQAEEAQRQSLEAQRKAKEEQLAAEAAQRQTRLEAESQAAKAALEQAEADKKRLDQELKRTVAEKAAADKTSSQPVAPKATEPQRTTSAPATVPPPKELKGIERFDGAYDGRLCSDRRGPVGGKRCWPVMIKVQRGAITGTWTNPGTDNVSRAKGTISTEGAVSMTLESWQINGRPTEASVTGSWDANSITVSGAWKSGLPVSGGWKRGF
jgi:hypothetical protein